jgi:glycine hydroxymethyltransferase
MNAPHRDDGFFTETLESRDPEIFGAIEKELGRQRDEIELIASENIVSAAVMAAQGSVMTNKYAEGYPGPPLLWRLRICRYRREPRHRPGQGAVRLWSSPTCSPIPAARPTRACSRRCCTPGDTILGMSLDAGGHLTHGAKPNQSGKWFNAIQYGVRQQDLADRLRPDRGADGRAQAEDDHRRRLRHPAHHRLRRMREIADSVGAYLLVDMAHFAGLVASGHYPSPFPHAHVATTTTHKTLRGPRGGMILTNDEDWRRSSTPPSSPASRAAR